jgi:hypothetical protein
MRPFGKRYLWISILLGSGCLAVQAAEPHGPVQARAPAATTVAAKPVQGSGLGPRVDAAVLASLSGGSDVDNTITLNGGVSNTSTENVSTGMNWIGGGAFGNAVGLPMVIQNSGNSVLIQNATIVNLQMQP